VREIEIVRGATATGFPHPSGSTALGRPIFPILLGAAIPS
jgi:hypothetical protein